MYVAMANTNLAKMVKEPTTLGILAQMNDRASIINQADVQNQLLGERQLLQAAQMDEQPRIPDQIWYDHLRQTDDGRYSNKHNVVPNLDIDQQHKAFHETRHEYLRRKILEKKPDCKRDKSPFVSRSRMHYAALSPKADTRGVIHSTQPRHLKDIVVGQIKDPPPEATSSPTASPRDSVPGAHPRLDDLGFDSLDHLAGTTPHHSSSVHADFNHAPSAAQAADRRAACRTQMDGYKTTTNKISADLWSPDAKRKRHARDSRDGLPSLRSKLPIDFEVVGKPNVLVNK